MAETLLPWPAPSAYWSIRPYKVSGEEMTDLRWIHLHHGHAETAIIGVKIDHQINEVFTDYATAQLKIQYFVNGMPISPWLDPPYEFTLNIFNPGLASLDDGIHDLSVRIQAAPDVPGANWNTPTYSHFKPYPAFLHIGGRPGYSTSTFVPVLAQNEQDPINAQQKDGNYVDAASLHPKAYPLNFPLIPWHSNEAPYNLDLYQEPMGPHTMQFYGQQMFWEEPPGTVSAGLRFIRAFPPKSGEYHKGLWDNGGPPPLEGGHSGHRSFPVKDGKRGIGWTNGYIQGQFDNQGILWFVNISGQLRVMLPDGEIITVVGWRVKPDKEPVWYLKSLEKIRQNMEFRGTGEFWPNDPFDKCWHQPMDVVPDPINLNIVYVASLYDNAIYKVTVDRNTWTGVAEMLAGDLNHSAGYVDGPGLSARFNNPFSLTISHNGEKLYVSDHENHAIRVVRTDTGFTTTLCEGQNLRNVLQGKPGINTATSINGGCWPASAVRPHVRVEVSAEQATSGMLPQVYFPGFIRITSDGQLVLFDRGLNTLRRINPTTGETHIISTLQDGGFDGDQIVSWVWGDVDRWGNSGELDAIYWGTFVSTGGFPPGETSDRFNENYRRTSLDGQRQSWIFGGSESYNLQGFGPVRKTLPPHYPWFIAVHPQGAIYLAGGGAHNITRLRWRQPHDPIPLSYPGGLEHQDARWIWEFGDIGPNSFYYTITGRPTTLTPSNPKALWHGQNGHNMLGLPNSWDINPTWTDEQILNHFQISNTVRQNPEATQRILQFLRYASGGGIQNIPVEIPPVLNFYASETEITEGESLTLYWNTVNGISCIANGNWVENPGLQGQAVVSPSETTSYTLTCFGMGNLSVSKTVTVMVSPVVQAPQITLTASATTITEGQSVELSWSSLFSVSCHASWSNSTETSGVQIVTPINLPISTYAITAIGVNGQAVTTSVNISVLGEVEYGANILPNGDMKNNTWDCQTNNPTVTSFWCKDEIDNGVNALLTMGYGRSLTRWMSPLTPVELNKNYKVSVYVNPGSIQGSIVLKIETFSQPGVYASVDYSHDIDILSNLSEMNNDPDLIEMSGLARFTEGEKLVRIVVEIQNTTKLLTVFITSAAIMPEN